LPQQFVLLPVTESYLDSEVLAHTIISPFMCLTHALWDSAVRWSSDCGVAYIETDYFGGIGTQQAIAWRDASIVFGPNTAETMVDRRSKLTRHYGGRPINDALAAIGVTTDKDMDEFDTLGLERFRSFDEIYDEN